MRRYLGLWLDFSILSRARTTKTNNDETNNMPKETTTPQHYGIN